jgi:hypothetical protein
MLSVIILDCFAKIMYLGSVGLHDDIVNHSAGVQIRYTYQL